MDRRPRNLRWPTALLLLLCATPAGAEAQQFVCWPIVRGDTASRLARQLTGDAAAVYTAAFQIRDPARGMFVPKSHYRRLSTGWQACVAREPARSTPVAYVPFIDSLSPPIRATPLPVLSTASMAVPDASKYDVVSAAKIAAAIVLILLLGVAAADSLIPRPVPPVMRRAGETFVSAFARPLIDSSSSDPPIHARLRFVRRRQQLEIAMAPGAGRRYPNLVDHKSNVEYDVNRVMRLLGPHFVVSDRLRATGKWVVVPIRLADQKQAGAK